MAGPVNLWTSPWSLIKELDEGRPNFVAQTSVKLLFDSSHLGLAEQLNRWLAEISGQVLVTGLSMDSNQYGHCLVIMYQVGAGGRNYRGHLFFDSGHGRLEEQARRGLAAAQAQWGKFVAVGSNDYGHCLCVIEEQ